MSWWDRHVVPRLIGFACAQPPIMARRALVVPHARGHVLEYGVGGGLNLPLYTAGQVSRITGIDPNAKLRAMAEAARPGPIPTEIVEGVAEDLPFEAGTFDTVLTTFTLCSVADQAQALAEARRVLKPGGQLLFLEHGRAPDSAVQKWQGRIEPLWKPIAGGCHLTRPIAKAIEAAGFRVTRLDQGYMDNSPKPMGWTEWGAATPR
jgi:ubiquinone/menaquinone biosynthesis C-methylase UbiE